MKNIAIFVFTLPLCLCGRVTKTTTETTEAVTAADTIKAIIIPNIDSLKKYTTMDNLTLTKQFELFDQERYDKRLDKSNKVLMEFLPDGTCVRMTDYDKSYGILPPDSYFELVKIYYPNGFIKMKGWEYVDVFMAGIWYEFNERGTLVAEVDYDAPFTFTFDDVLEFCRKNKIEVQKGYVSQGTGFHTSINRWVEDGEPVWYIDYLKEWNLIEILYLDGKTGKIICKETSDWH